MNKQKNFSETKKKKKIHPQLPNCQTKKFNETIKISFKDFLTFIVLTQFIIFIFQKNDYSQLITQLINIKKTEIRESLLIFNTFFNLNLFGKNQT